MTDTPKPDTPPDAPLFHVFNEIGIIAQLSSTAFARVLPDGLTMAQFSVLNHFARLGGEKSPLRLAQAFQVTKGAMTNTLQRLEARGLVAIRPDPEDGRGKLVRITDDGLAMRERALARLRPPLAKVQEAFGTEAFAQALPFLAELRQHLDQARNAADFAHEETENDTVA